MKRIDLGVFEPVEERSDAGFVGEGGFNADEVQDLVCLAAFWSRSCISMAVRSGPPRLSRSGLRAMPRCLGQPKRPPAEIITGSRPRSWAARASS